MKINRRFCKMLIITMIVTIFCGCGNKTDKVQQPLNPNGATSTEKTQETTDKQTDKATKAEQKTTEADTSVTLPDVVGKSLDNATALLESAGFKINLKEESSDTVEKDIIISQSPTVDNNLKLKKGDVVTITVSSGKKTPTVQYLDTIVYSSFISESKNTKMSAYTGKDFFKNECTRAIKFECDNNKNNYSNPDGTQVVKVIYTLDDTRTKFACKLAPLSFFNAGYSASYMKYVHVNLYKDDTILYSMDISKDSQPLDLSYDLTGGSTFTIELKYEVNNNASQHGASIVFSEARFE